MMDDLLEPLDGEGLQPGDLVRTTPASIGIPPDTATSDQEENIEQNDSHRVLVVDDAEDLRMLLRARMETRNGLTVVGEAADGLAAVSSPPSCSRISSCSISRCRAWTASRHSR